ncbi:AsnC family transcriptional regulator [Boudabousia liubingyangii]|uniref:AsnC family transcriptional regulator n=1 Tax=Boudabousia liubingyangii TaxID=1921764 RepID=A0A1Q5PPP4_9ACTO|nr:Lrp/AsnC family transcriptional regulator [Boudabousia liubingyangii]OKL48406.1 AsnC family transcriptional regulator [Boudabousia liubingyangii]OKL49568.1 AsnC family transcriptional regulator [Boudabousia liubingyangii]
MSTTLDSVDQRILAILDEDPRMPVLAISERTGLARGTIHTRLAKYREENLLRDYSTCVPPEHLGRPLLAKVSLQLSQHYLDKAIEELSNIPEVVECLASSGETDLEVRVAAVDTDDLYRVCDQIRLVPGVERTSTTVFLRALIPYRIRGLVDTLEPKRKN